eukprot:3795720-Prymnesium_polylepis.1
MRLRHARLERRCRRALASPARRRLRRERVRGGGTQPESRVHRRPVGACGREGLAGLVRKERDPHAARPARAAAAGGRLQYVAKTENFFARHVGGEDLNLLVPVVCLTFP